LMLHITREATRYLLRAREARGLDEGTGARFVRTSSGTVLTFVPGPQPLDRVVGDDDLRIYLDENLAAALNRSIIDVRTEGGRSRLAIRPATISDNA
jgi:Fe-S cluster assembly iron-binding protein IscA